MSEADVNVPDAQAQTQEQAYTAQEEPKGRQQDDADGDTGRKKETKSETKKETKQKKVEENTEASEADKQKKEYKKEELRRLREILEKEKSQRKKPESRPHYPVVWTSLYPYCGTYEADYLINVPGDEREPEPAPRSRSLHTPAEFRYKYVSRNTAHGLCDPWDDLRMDREILPKIGSAHRTSTRGSYSLGDPAASRKSRESKKEKKDSFGGSTRLPKFPVVPFQASKENATQRFPYQDIPKFRQEMDQRFSLHAPQKIDQDYKRTKDDFYRMELDKLGEIHPQNRPHMRKAYFAYLQNTPGSKKAISECVKSLDGPPREFQTGSAQAQEAN